MAFLQMQGTKIKKMSNRDGSSSWCMGIYDCDEFTSFFMYRSLTCKICLMNAKRRHSYASSQQRWGNGEAEIMALLVIVLVVQSDTICQISRNSWRLPVNKKDWAPRAPVLHLPCGYVMWDWLSNISHPHLSILIVLLLPRHLVVRIGSHEGEFNDWIAL